MPDLIDDGTWRAGCWVKAWALRCPSFREATDGRESDMIYVICVAALVLAAY
jgi:hypothetical protein